MESVKFVETQKQQLLEESLDPCISTTTIKPEVSGDCSVQPVIPGSENLEIIQITLKLPQGTSEGSLKFYNYLKEIALLHAQKQQDYGRRGDPFANVRCATEWGIRPWVGAMNRATDKIKRLQKYALTGKLSNEGARDSFLDLAVYALIALILWEDGNNEYEK